MIANRLADRCVLITGSTGLIGSAVVRRLGTTGTTLRLGRRTPGPVDPNTVLGDVRDPRFWNRAMPGVDAVIHLAAQTSLRVAERHPAVDRAINVTALRHLLVAARKYRRRPVVLIAGTETQAGIPASIPLDERSPDRPVTVYDRNKLIAERLLKSAVRRGTVRGACLRFPTVYGPGPRERAADRGMVGTVVRQALAGTPLSVFGSGSWRRDFLYVDDAAEAFVAALQHVDAVDGRHFVVGTGVGVPVADLMHTVAAVVARHTGRPPVPVRQVAPPNGWRSIDERDIVLNARAFRAATGWRPHHDLAAGLADLVSFLHSQPGEV